MKAKKLLDFWKTTVVTGLVAQAVLIQTELYRLILFCVLILCSVLVAVALQKKEDVEQD